MDEPARMTEPAEEPLGIEIDEVRPDLVVVRLDGDLDLLTAPLLRERLLPLLDHADRVVVIDFSGVTFLGSAGLSELAAAADAAGRNDARIVLVATAHVVLRPLEITGLHTVFPIFDSIESALRDL